MIRLNGIMTNPPLCITEEQLEEGFAASTRRSRSPTARSPSGPDEAPTAAQRSAHSARPSITFARSRPRSLKEYSIVTGVEGVTDRVRMPGALQLPQPVGQDRVGDLRDRATQRGVAAGSAEEHPHDLGNPALPDELGSLLEALADGAFRVHGLIVAAQLLLEASEY